MGYKVKPPKCGCEFWRRERRVKKAPHPEILIRKLEIKRLKCSIQNVREIISDTIRQQGRAGGLVLEYAEAIREKNRFGIDLADFDTRPMKTSSKSWKQFTGTKLNLVYAETLSDNFEPINYCSGSYDKADLLKRLWKGKWD